MEIFGIYAVKDELTNKFLSPFFFESEAEAKRTFKTHINTITIWKDNSSDYSLYKIGTFDQTTGSITSEIEKITNGRSVLNA